MTIDPDLSDEDLRLAVYGSFVQTGRALGILEMATEFRTECCRYRVLLKGQALPRRR